MHALEDCFRVFSWRKSQEDFGLEFQITAISLLKYVFLEHREAERNVFNLKIPCGTEFFAHCKKYNFNLLGSKLEYSSG